MGRRRGCGKVGIPPVLRDFQAEWKTCFWFSTEWLFRSLAASRVRLLQQRPTLRVIPTHDMGPVADGQRAIQMLVQHHSTTGQAAPPARGLDLQPAISELNGVVASHRADLVEGENQVQIPMPTGQERAARLSRRDAEALIELGRCIPPLETRWLKPRQKRTFHVLTRPDIIMCYRQRHASELTRWDRGGSVPSQRDVQKRKLRRRGYGLCLRI